MRVLVAAWVGSANAGDELIFTALRQKLQERGAEVSAVSISPSETSIAHGVESVASRNPAAVFAAVRRSDAVVFGGGGLLQDETSHFNLPYHLSRLWMAKAAGTPFVGVGLGAYGLAGSAARRWVRSALRGHQGVTVRDAHSASLLSSIGVQDVRTAADLVFSLAPRPVSKRDRLVVSLRSWPRSSRTLPMSVRSRRDVAPTPMVNNIASQLDRISKESGFEVRFVAFHRGRDDVLHQLIADRMRGTVSMVAPHPHEILDEVGRASAVITMRYHGGVAAAMHGRPIVFLGGSAKLGALAAELGRGTAVVPREPDALSALPRVVGELLSSKDEVRTAADRLRAQAANNDLVLDSLFDDVSQIRR
jgi:polysaccharide pyruvyl transferase CsaB